MRNLFVHGFGKTHELKTWPNFFEKVITMEKKFDVRKNDRDFQIGDILLLKEWDPNKEIYTGAVCTRQIKYILLGGDFGIESDYCVLGIEPF